MSALLRLKAMLAEKRPPKELTKPTKVPSVGSVSEQGSPFCADEGKTEDNTGLAAGSIPHVAMREMNGRGSPLLAGERPLNELTKLTKRASVSSVSERGSRFCGDEAAVQERAGMAADRVPALYLDTWARLNCQKPERVSGAEWRLALDDGGRFLDGWGLIAAELQWSAGDLFDVPHGSRSGGLVWRLGGVRVEALGPDHARLGDGREVMRGEFDRMERRPT